MSQLAVTLLSVLSVLALGFLTIPGGLHHVPEGSVGLYWFGGRLTDAVTQPGLHWHSPLTSFRAVQVSMQTDSVRDIPCGTSGGVVLYFSRIDVVNRLKPEFVLDTVRNYTVDYDRLWIFDRIHHAINEFCSVHSLQQVYVDKFEQLDDSLMKSLQTVCDQWAPGIEIIAVRVTKPVIPAAIQKNYELMEEEKTNYLIATQKQQVILREAETAKRKAVIAAEQARSVAEINAKRRLAEQMKLKEMSLIQDQVMLDQIKSQVDADYYRVLREAEGNAALLTPEYLRWQRIRGTLSNTTIVFGDSIPQSFLSSGRVQEGLNALGGLGGLSRSEDPIREQQKS